MEAAVKTIRVSDASHQAIADLAVLPINPTATRDDDGFWLVPVDEEVWETLQQQRLTERATTMPSCASPAHSAAQSLAEQLPRHRRCWGLTPAALRVNSLAPMVDDVDTTVALAATPQPGPRPPSRTTARQRSRLSASGRNADGTAYGRCVRLTG